MAQSIHSKSVYSSIMNRWIFGVNATGKSSSIFKDGYDDPTYMTFKVEFGDWGASILDRSIVQNGITEFGLAFNDYDQLPMGLLNCPYEGAKDQDAYWQNNAKNDYKIFNNTKFYSAFQYLRSRNEDTRAKYLYYFVNGLYEIQHDYPFIFKKVSGLNELEKFDATAGQRLKNPAKITLECYEGLDLKIRTLFEFYRKAAWDDVYQRWILPENMREFKMIIYVFERRIFQDTQMFNVDDQLHMKMSFGKLNADIPVKAYECMPCEFNIGDSMSWNDSYSSGTENNEESSKLVIDIKNVKTYFKNGLLSDRLSKVYDNMGKSSLSNDIQQKIDSIMIYDLVESIERSNQNITEAENIQEYNSSSQFTNLTVNGAKAMFLDKRILLENEEANINIKSYIWGNSTTRTFEGDYNSTSSYNDDKVNLVRSARRDFKYEFLEDNTRYRGGWTFSLTSPPTYDSNKSFWSNLGDNILNVLTGTRRLVLMSGAANLQRIAYCLIDSFYIPGHVYDAIPKYSNGFGKNKIKNYAGLKSRILDDQEFLNINEARFINDQKFLEIEKEREILDQEYSKLNKERDIPEQEYSELEKERYIPKQEYNELNSRINPDQEFSELEKERYIPEQSYNDLTGRRIPVHDYIELEKERDIPTQYYRELDKERKLEEQDYRKLDDERGIPKQDYRELNKERDLDEQKYRELDKERDLDEQKYRELEKEREIVEQKYKEIEKPRNTDIELMELLLIARSLPGFKDLNLEDIRKLPKQDLLNLKEAEERTVPIYNADKSALLDVIKNVEGSNMKLLELDKDNKMVEDISLEMLQKNQALANFTLSDIPGETADEKAEKLKKITAFTKEFSENSDKVRKAYTTNILGLKNDLKNITKDIVNQLPINDTQIVKRDDKEHNNLDKVLMSQNDVDQINHNMKYLAISDNEVEKLSFQTLITLQDELGDAVQRSKAVVGLTSIAKNSVATNPNKKIRNKAKESVIEEPKKDNIKVIY